MKWPWHRHQWTVIAASQGEYVILGGTGTAVLLRCDGCGTVNQRTINGYWTIEQLRGKP